MDCVDGSQSEERGIDGRAMAAATAAANSINRNVVVGLAVHR